MSVTNTLYALPPEIDLFIRSFLSVEDLLNSSLVCKAWNKLNQHPFLWSARLKKHFPKYEFIETISLKSQWLNQTKIKRLNGSHCSLCHNQIYSREDPNITTILHCGHIFHSSCYSYSKRIRNPLLKCISKI